MALIHNASLNPTKLELLAEWLPSRAWFTDVTGGDSQVRQLGAYRFDDPAGEVGLEGFLLAGGSGAVLHVPLSYRGAPLAGAGQYLVGTMEHSVLGRRWVYDGCGDPVWVQAVVTAVLTGGTGSPELVEQEDGALVSREPTATVRGSGDADWLVLELDPVTSHDDGLVTIVQAKPFELTTVRVIGAAVSAEQTLTGRWAGGEGVLAGVRSLA